MSPLSFQLLAGYAQGAPVAVGAGGERCVAALLRDVASLAAALPAPSPNSEVLIACADRYRFAASLLAAWHRGHSAALPPNVQPETVRLLAGARTSRRACTTAAWWQVSIPAQFRRPRNRQRCGRTSRAADW